MPALLLFAFVLAAQDKPPEKCSLSGTVVNSVTGEPLNKVELALGAAGTAGAAVTTSDSEGRFSMVDLEPGRYHLTGKRNGYLDTAYGARHADADGTVLRLEAGQALKGLTLKLMPYGVIAGTIRDSDGEPLADAHVTARRQSFANGTPSLEGYGDAETDDLGQYRMRGLAPGKYYISAKPEPGPYTSVDHSAGKAPLRMDVPTVYPGSADAAMAVPVEVKPGARVGGIDITMARARTFSIKGRVVTAAGSGSGGAEITLRGRDQGSDPDRGLRTMARKPDGEFELRGVPDGRYRLSAWGDSQLAVMSLEVANNMESVTVILGPGASVKAKLATEGGAKVEMGQRRFFLMAGEGRGFLLQFDSDSAAVERNVPADHYEVQNPNEVPVGWYVKSIRSGEIDVLADGLTVPAGGTVEFEILLASDGGKVDGTVADSSGNPAVGATVLLAPEPGLRGHSGLFKSTTTDQSGHYEFHDLRPGDYKVFGWDDIEEGIWIDPAFLKECEKKGEPVTVRAKSKQTVNVTQI